jgi:DNA-binding MarR family transcriptional regulator
VEASSDEHRLETAFCRQLELLSSWKRKRMPILEMPQGSDVLVWLLKGGVQSRPLKDLYGSSRFSEPTIRWVLKALEDDGFIVIEKHTHDLRVRTVQITPKLKTAVREYLTLLRHCASSDIWHALPAAGGSAKDARGPWAD